MRCCVRCDKNRATRFFSPRGRICKDCIRKRASESAHAHRLKVLYDITPAEYAALLKKQGGACAICGGKRRYRLNVDHDHKVEREKGVRASVRGLLCRRCNKLLRDIRDNAVLLKAAAAYLVKWPSKGVIK